MKMRKLSLGAASIAVGFLMLGRPAFAASLLTGDRIDGVPVIEKLDLADQPAGQVSRYYFRVTDQAIGQGWYVPVIVVKGALPGKRLLLTAAVHGDELNGIAIIQDLTAGLNLANLKGAVIALPGLNIPGLLQDSRGFSPSATTTGANLNRQMPGDVTSGDISRIYAGRLWTQIFSGNADAAVDLHTQSRGSAYPMYVFAETSAARDMARALGPDMIKYDPGERGSIETTLNANGVDAVTLEMGEPDRFDPLLISRALSGLRNVMRNLEMIDSPAEPSAVSPFIGNRTLDVIAGHGGFVRILAPIGSEVTVGQPVATISDPFGRIISTARATMAGRILSVATSPMREAGSLLVRILAWSEDPACAARGCP